MSKEILIGSHISSAGSLHLAFQRGESIGCAVMQIFTKSSRMWGTSKIKDVEAEAFKQAAKSSTIKTVVAHTGYLINLGATNTITLKKSIKSLCDEIERCETLEIPYLVLHPGSHLGVGEERCMDQIVEKLEEALDYVPGKTMILLETMAGQGTNVGYKFEQIIYMIDSCKSKYHKRLGVCLDTCHIFAAGYDISNKQEYEKTFKLFNKIVGHKHLQAIHINNSYGKLGSRIDRHAPIKEGAIPVETFKLIMNDKTLTNIPKILETPSDPEMKLWKQEIEFLKNLVKK
jgi:deoxyribonuclease-4